MTFQHCNGFVTCKGRSGELLYTTFIDSRLYTLSLYPEEFIQKFSIFSGLPEQKCIVGIRSFWKKLMVITTTKIFQIFETTTLRFWVQQLHWIKLTLNVQKMLKLNPPEIIQVLLPAKAQSILLVNGYTTVAI